MKMIDLVRELSLALSDWKRYESVSKSLFMKDRDTQNMVLHAIFLAIQASIDVAAWLISSQKISKKPGSYRETFEILAQYHIIDSDLGQSLADLASLRNIIIHQYSVLDLEETYEVLVHERIFLEQFRDIILEIT